MACVVFPLSLVSILRQLTQITKKFTLQTNFIQRFYKPTLDFHAEFLNGSWQEIEGCHEIFNFLIDNQRFSSEFVTRHDLSLFKIILKKKKDYDETCK